MPAPTLTDAKILARLLDAAGVPLPPAAVRAFKLADKVREILDRPHVNQLLADLDADKLTDQNIEKRSFEAGAGLGNEDGMRRLLLALDAPLGLRAYNACRGDRDRVINDLRPRVLAAGQTIVDGLRHMRADDYEKNAEKVLAAGAEAAAAYHSVLAAIGVLEPMVQLINTLVVANRPGMPPNWAYFTNVDPAKVTEQSRDQLNAAFHGSTARWLRLWAVPGTAPALHTLAEAERVNAAVTAGESRAAATRRLSKQSPADQSRNRSAQLEADAWKATVPAAG